MSSLQYELMQTASGLSDDSLKFLLDYIRTYILPFDGKTASIGKDITSAAKPRRLGSRKGVKYVADGHDIDDFNDEIEALFGVSDR